MYTEESYKAALRAFARAGALYVSAVRKDPRPVSEPHQAMSGVKPVGLKQWLVPAGELLESIDKEFPLMEKGEVRQLMTATGAGKTTKVPVHIATRHKKNVVVLMPSDIGVRHVQSYVGASNSAVYVMKPTHFKKESQRSGGVWYTTVGDFLGVFASEPNIMELCDVGCVIVDESHEPLPEYFALRYLVAAGKFGDTKVFYSSATAATDVSMENNSMKKVQQYSPSVIPLSPEALTTSSPAHYSHITNRTVMFLACDEDFPAWKEYYAAHDIPTLAYGHTHGTTAFKSVQAFLDSRPMCVLLTTSVLQTGVTLNVDTVIDCGYSSALCTDFGAARVELKIEACTKSDQVQRIGRVGRYKPGVAHVANVAFSPPTDLSDPDLACKVYLWLRAFNIQVRDPQVSAFEQVFKGLSNQVVCVMLTMTLPPFAVLPYFADDGVHQSFVKPLSLFSTLKDLPVSTQPDVDTDAWNEAFMEVFEEDCDESYKYRVKLPASWQLVSFHLFSERSETDYADLESLAITENDMNERRASIMRSASRKMSKVVTAPRAPSVSSISSMFSSRPISVHRRGVSGASLQDLMEIPEEPPESPVKTRTALPASPPEYTPRKGVSFAHGNFAKVMSDPLGQVGEPSNVEQWIAQSASSSSGEIAAMDLKEVRPEKYWSHQLYPMDPNLCHEFRVSYAVSPRDKGDVGKLLKGTLEYANMSSNPERLRALQKSAFLSVLRVHRALLTQILQANAMETGRRLFQKDAATKLSDKAYSVALLIRTCVAEGYTVGIDRSSRHSLRTYTTQNSMSQAQSATEFLLRNMGSLATSTSTPGFSDTVRELKAAFAYPRCQQGVTVCNGWCFNGHLVVPAHAFEECESNQLLSMLGVDKLETDGDVATAGVDYARVEVPVRAPYESEVVSVVGVYPGHSRARVYGYYKVQPYADAFVMDGIFGEGMSGALLVSHTDGSVVGMYVGFQLTVAGQHYSRVETLPLDRLT